MSTIKEEECQLYVFKKSEPSTFWKVARALNQVDNAREKNITCFSVKWREREEVK